MPKSAFAADTETSTYPDKNILRQIKQKIKKE